MQWIKTPSGLHTLYAGQDGNLIVAEAQKVGNQFEVAIYPHGVQSNPVVRSYGRLHLAKTMAESLVRSNAWGAERAKRNGTKGLYDHDYFNNA